MATLVGSLSKAAFRFTSAIFRRAGMADVHPDWAARAAACETCPLRVVAGRVSYCGQPYYRKIERDLAEDGCGCPTREKARDPGEHCPLTSRNQASRAALEAEGAAAADTLAAAGSAGACDCKWCATVVCPTANAG